jgi:hypothetical protein
VRRACLPVECKESAASEYVRLAALHACAVPDLFVYDSPSSYTPAL